jgi:predicted 3-demethylubiquinone-9 3-methyltransferase (glyoxalase superfamily)
VKRITPCLCFDGNAPEAVKFYTSIFRNSKVGKTSCYGEDAPLPKGGVLTIEFSLDGRDFLALNAVPEFRFTEAISLMVPCRTRKEVDRIWAGLSAGGRQVQCGWLKDKSGLPWQVVPAGLVTMLTGKDRAPADRVFHALHGMVKLDIAALRKSYADGQGPICAKKPTRPRDGRPSRKASRRARASRTTRRD